MKQIQLLVLCVLMLPALVHPASGTDSEGRLGVEIRVPAKQASPVGPVAVILTLTNSGPEAIHDLRILEDPEAVVLQYRPDGTDAWTPVPAPYLFLKHTQGEMSLSPPRTLQLNSASSVAVEYWLTIDLRETAREKRSHYLFSPPGTYEMRAIYNSGLGFKVTSNVILIESLPYAGQDKAAADWLLSLPYSHFLFERAYHRSVTVEEGGKIAEEVVRRYPASCFYPWARLYLIRFAETPSAGLDKLQDLDEELDDLADLNMPILSAEARMQKKTIEKRKRRLSSK